MQATIQRKKIKPVVCSGILITFVLTLLTAGCAVLRGFEVDKNLMDNQSVFKTSQEPRFSMRMAKGTVYKGEKDERTVKADLGYVEKIYQFINKDEKYLILVEMTTVSAAEWGADRPYTKELKAEVHGETIFSCGIGVLKETTDSINKNWLTYKAWVYVPGGNGTPGTTRVTVYYIEGGDQREDLDAFVTRANARMDFTMD